jgi:hypothetical protein
VRSETFTTSRQGSHNEEEEKKKKEEEEEEEERDVGMSAILDWSSNAIAFQGSYHTSM